MSSSRKRKTTRTVAKTTTEKPLVAAQAAVASKTETKSEVKPVAPLAKEESKVAASTAETAKPVVKEETKPVVEKETAKAVEKAVAKADEKKAEETVPKKRGRKPGSVNKTTAKKKAAEKEVVQEVYIEYNQDQILTKELVEKIQETYKNEGHRISSIKSLRVYINLEERRAYYVINDKSEGKFVEF